MLRERKNRESGGRGAWGRGRDESKADTTAENDEVAKRRRRGPRTGRQTITCRAETTSRFFNLRSTPRHRLARRRAAASNAGTEPEAKTVWGGRGAWQGGAGRCVRRGVGISVVFKWGHFRGRTSAATVAKLPVWLVYSASTVWPRATKPYMIGMAAGGVGGQGWEGLARVLLWGGKRHDGTPPADKREGGRGASNPIKWARRGVRKGFGYLSGGLL